MKRRAVRFSMLGVRARQLASALALVSLYLGTGVAWKIHTLLKYPPAKQNFANAVYEAIHPYASLPVGYALGPRFGRLAIALRLAHQSTAKDRSPSREAAAIERDLYEVRGPWSDIAGYSLAVLEASPDQLQTPSRNSPVATFWLILDRARWGRSTAPVSPSADDAMRLFRSLPEQFPKSPIASDALIKLAEMEEARWEFSDAAVTRLTASILRAEELKKRQDIPGRLVLARAYAAFLRASASDRERLKAILETEALKAKDTALITAMQFSVQSRSLSSEPAAGWRIRATRDGQPLAGTKTSLMDMMGVQSALASVRPPDSAPGGPRINTGGILGDLASVNAARHDDSDYLRVGAAILFSGPLAVAMLQHLPVVATDSGGWADFFEETSEPSAAAVRSLSLSGQSDVCLRPTGVRQSPIVLEFVPRIQVLPPTLSSERPPVLRWEPYPGAAQYRVSVALEAPAAPASTSTTLSPDWDDRVLWWKDGVRDTQVLLSPEGFIGPASDLARNGLWIGDTYRVVVTAEDRNGLPVASSIGARDHPEEFFSPNQNWLALNRADSMAPAVIEPSDLNLNRFFRRRRSRTEREHRPHPAATDPLEHVLEAARSLSTPSLSGLGRELSFSAAPAHSKQAVTLAAWPSSTSNGRDREPLPAPYLPGAGIFGMFGSGGPAGLNPFDLKSLSQNSP